MCHFWKLRWGHYFSFETETLKNNWNYYKHSWIKLTSISCVIQSTEVWDCWNMAVTDSWFAANGIDTYPQTNVMYMCTFCFCISQLNQILEYPDTKQSHLSLVLSSTRTSYSPSKKVFLSSVLHDSHCRLTFFPSSFSPAEEPRFLAADLEFPAGLLGGIPDVPPDVVPPLSAPAKNHGY